MRHVTEAISNLKNGAKATLGPKTLIVGPNASGKSAIIKIREEIPSGSGCDRRSRSRARR